jgi:hypothetical protein
LRKKRVEASDAQTEENASAEAVEVMPDATPEAAAEASETGAATAD